MNKRPIKTRMIEKKLSKFSNNFNIESFDVIIRENSDMPLPALESKCILKLLQNEKKSTHILEELDENFNIIIRPPKKKIYQLDEIDESFNRFYFKGERGEIGPKGDNGDPGLQGPHGPQGPQGEIGPKGDKGDKGDQGDVGPMGPQGEQGIPGLNGEKGDPGLQGLPGPQGPQGLNGEKGDRGEQGFTGPIGPPGPQGPIGPMGIKGPQGEQGPPGPLGMPGPQGVMGPPGQRGEKGDPGPMGPEGPEGKQGYRGSRGAKGDQGEQGIPGPPGPEGKQGYRGSRGEKGPKGDKGDPGENGLPGPQGEPGPKGDKGDPPKHEAMNNRIRFELPDGKFGPWLDLSKAIKLPAPQIMGGGGAEPTSYSYGTYWNDKITHIDFDMNTFDVRQVGNSLHIRSYGTTATTIPGTGGTVVVSGGIPNYYVENFRVNASGEKSFILTHVPTEHTELLTINGLVMSKGIDYTLNDNILVLTPVHITKKDWIVRIQYIINESAPLDINGIGLDTIPTPVY